jgi:serine/threonine protein kinase
MSDTADLERRLAQFVEHHVHTGGSLSVDSLCSDRPELAPRLRPLIQRYLMLTTSLDGGAPRSEMPATSAELPRFDGFQTIERIGGGGMGEVYKLRDLRLNRIVAAKVMRRQSNARRAALDAGDVLDFLKEARALALFSDRRIVQIFEVRPDAQPPVIIMEFVEGFELGRLGPSLDFPQRARVMAEICDAVHHAHGLGLTHRDLKPANVMLDSQLVPRILDFGLSGGDPQSGHLKGTLPYIAPEQLDPAHPIDARTDVYGLGAILYELLCGAPPHAGLEHAALLTAIRSGHPRLPVEIDPRVPEPLQAIALAAMEVEPARRYQSALEMAADLRRFLDGRPVQARPSIYASTLSTRTRPHLTDIQDWLRLRLIYPHEADRLQEAYRALEAREDDWILESRALSYPQIALYLGAFLLVAGSLFYFVAARWHEAVDGIVRPFAVLGLPFIGLNVAAHWLYSRDHKAVAVAFYLGAVALLPLFLLIAFHETGFLVVPEGSPGQLFPNGSVSNRQLQITIAAAALWCGWLSFRTRTMALSTVFNVLALLFTLAVISDFGLRDWLEEGHWDRLALHLFPLVAAYAAIGVAAERTRRVWLSRPAYTASAVMLVAVLELLALNGRMFSHLGLSLTALQPAGVSDRTLLDTVAAMTLNGALFYVVAAAVDRRRGDPARVAARFLFTIAPFAMLQPLGWLVKTAEYSRRIDWLYAAAACVVMMLSHRRQRRSFYYAGLLNLGNALYLIADHRHWFNRPAWAVLLIAAGLAALGAGLLLDRRERLR